jgi:hypothetical protein
MSNNGEGSGVLINEAAIAAGSRSGCVFAAGSFDIRYSTFDIPAFHTSPGAPLAHEGPASIAAPTKS